MFTTIKSWYIASAILLGIKPTPPIPPLVLTNTTRKKADTTKFTKHHYDYILYAHTECLIHNMTCSADQKMTTIDLTAYLNKVFKLDKSKSSYARVWLGNIPRDTLPEHGKSFFGEES